MAVPHPKFTCTACGQIVLNRAIKHCLYCGEILPSEFLFSEEKIASLNKETRRSTPREANIVEKIAARQAEESNQFDQHISTSSADRSDGTKVLDAIAGGLIGLFASTVLLLLIFKRVTWLSPWIFFWLAFGGTFVSSVGSYVYGANFLDRLFFKVRSK